MDIEEAIEIVCIGREELLSIKGANGIVNLLREGEKFEKMWEELKNINPPAILNFVKDYDDVHTVIKQSKVLRNFTMYRLEQKYFPKPKCPKPPANFTEKVMEKMEKIKKEERGGEKE